MLLVGAYTNKNICVAREVLFAQKTHACLTCGAAFYDATHSVSTRYTTIQEKGLHFSNIE